MKLWYIEKSCGDGSIRLVWFDNEEAYKAYLKAYEEHDPEPFCEAGHVLDTDDPWFKQNLNPVYEKW